jgi:DNA-binding response OmpR family regulator
VLDQHHQGTDGLGVCRALRQGVTTPILLIATGAEEEDRVAGLEAGADDYLARPFSIREFMVRVRVLLRRAELARAERDAAIESTARPQHLDDLAIDTARREVRRNGQILHLKPREYDLLRRGRGSPGRQRSRSGARCSRGIAFPARFCYSLPVTGSSSIRDAPPARRKAVQAGRSQLLARGVVT